MKLEFGKIVNGDCLEVMKHIPDKSIDYAFTSPPYNRERNDKYDFYSDVKADYYEFLSEAINELTRITRNHVFFNVQSTYYNKEAVYKIIGKWASKIQQIIVWEKINAQPSSNNSITNAYEFFYRVRGRAIKNQIFIHQKYCQYRGEFVVYAKNASCCDEQGCC